MNSADITISEFEALIGEAYKLDTELDDIKRDQVSPRQKKLEEVEGKILEYLAILEKTSYKSDFGTVVRQNRYSVLTPKTVEQKKAFFLWLKEKGEDVYWQYTSVNSNSLNALYKEELEIAKENGDLQFSLPGIGEPTVMTSLAKRKK